MPSIIERRERKDGKVSYRSRLKNAKGQWVRRTFDRRKDAVEWVEEARGRKRRRRPVEPSLEHLEDYLQRWLGDVAVPRLRENTAAQYRWNLEKYVIPELGEIPMGDLTAGDIAGLYRDMRDSGLSERTIKLTHAVLRNALKWAIADQQLLYNPASAVELPHRRKQEKKAMTPEQAKKFLKAAKGDPHEVLLTFLLFTGLRPSEAFALQWDDVDFKENTATVRRSLVRTKGQWRFAEPKTDAGNRTIPLSDELVEQLRRHRAAVGKRRLKLGETWSHNDLVFPGEFGEPIDISALRRRHFNPICINAKLAVEIPTDGDEPTVRPIFTLYSLRHTTASLLARAGTHPKVAATLLGHADTATTLQVYTHSAPDLERSATDAVAELVPLKPRKGPTRVPQTP